MADITESDWVKFFPFSAPRLEQVTAINFTLNAMLNEGKRFVVCELGTGTGKSAIGLTVSRYLNSVATPDDNQPGGYFITTQKILQDQYNKDFATMMSLKSSSNYLCNHNKGTACDENQKLLKVEPRGSKFYNNCMTNCVYKIAKDKFLQSQESVTNFPYFLTESTFSGKIGRRKILIIDEAHNAVDELSRFIEISVSEAFCERVLKIPFLSNGETQLKATKWIEDAYLPKLRAHVAFVKTTVAKMMETKEQVVEILGLARQIEMLNSHLSKLDKFISVYNADNWVMNLIEAEGKALRKLEFKAIDVSPFAEGYLFRLGEKVLLMSATILSKAHFCAMLGIPDDQVSFITIPSPFPKENRPIFFAPVGKMGKENIAATLPKLAEAVEAIIAQHPNEKGIIHAQTYQIAQYLKKNVKTKRLLIHDNMNREEVLRKHMQSKSPTILLSPSMTEGVDLKGDASRFQVICKVPFPYLGDKLCKKRMAKWDWWYSMATTKTVVQATGRSVRSIDDYAVTYILDQDWDRFYDRNKELFPQEFRDCIQSA